MVFLTEIMIGNSRKYPYLYAMGILEFWRREREVHKLQLLSHVLEFKFASFSGKPNSNSIRSLHFSFTELKTTKYVHFLEGVKDKYPFNNKKVFRR